MQQVGDDFDGVARVSGAVNWVGLLRLLGSVNGRVAGEEGAQAGNGGEGLVVEAEQVGHDALVEVDAGGVDGTAVEGLEGGVLEFRPDGLGLVELPGLEPSHVQRRERIQNSLFASPSFAQCP